ncbi:DUF5946 family protein [Nonomuraea guangzhouensis]|uniref:DUF5946 family protein n=1 Tax=Nonomuraea guangzhouensis TaxID=1291555 RepID=A0ABW4GN21_9ACTN|nr:DUF5946 family protein [Nonomuraea guangzhouensis]
MARCAECGALEECEALFHLLITLEFSARAPWAPVHAVSVACFYLQHSSRLPESGLGFYWAVLHVYVRGGLAALGPMTQRAQRLNSHRFGGLKPGADAFVGTPPLPDPSVPPTAYDTTIADVALDGSFPAEGHEERMRHWATATVDAWQAQGR